MKGKKPIIAAIVASCVLGSAVLYTTVSGRIEEAPEPEPSTPRPVRTEIVTELSEVSSRSFPGTVRATGRVDLAFSVDGLLAELHATEGTLVKKGDVVAQLDQRDAENAYQASRARYEVAQKDFDRAKMLIGRKVIPQADYDDIEANYNIALAEMRIREKALDDTVLTAPFDGIVSNRSVENFQHIKAKDRIISIKDISAIDVVIQVPERLIAHGGSDRFARVRVGFDAIPQVWFDAVIKEFSIESDPITRTYDVVVSLSPPEGVTIFPGMTATVKAQFEADHFVASLDTKKMLIPLAAVVGEAGGSAYVWKIPERGGHPVKTTVEIGEVRRGGIEIHRGLKTGDLVAVAGVHSLRGDMFVRPALPDREGLDQ
jgi:RND family efflux transporter MFP subunit